MDSYNVASSQNTRRLSIMTVPAIRVESPAPSDDVSNTLHLEGGFLSPDELGLTFMFDGYHIGSDMYTMSAPLSPVDGFYEADQYFPQSGASFPSGDGGHDATEQSSQTFGAPVSDQMESPYLTGPDLGMSLIGFPPATGTSSWPGGFYVEGSSSQHTEPYVDPPPPSPSSWRSLSIEPSPLLSAGSLSPSPTSAELGSPFSFQDVLPHPDSGRGRLRRSVSNSSRRPSPYGHRPSASIPSVSSDMLSPETASPPTRRRRSFPSSDRPCVVEQVATEAMRLANESRRRNPAQHSCDSCGQTFTTVFSLSRHKQSHTGEKPYKCSKPGCNQAFFNNSDCKRHEKSLRKHKHLLS